MTYSLDGIISNAVVRSGGAGRSGLHMILQIGMYSYFRMFIAPSYAYGNGDLPIWHGSRPKKKETGMVWED